MATQSGEPDKGSIHWPDSFAALSAASVGRLGWSPKSQEWVLRYRAARNASNRLRQNDNVSYELEYLPYLRELLDELSGCTRCLAMAASDVGRGCMTLMVNLIYENRARPLMWFVFGRPQGHSSAQTHWLEEALEIAVGFRLPPQFLFA